MAFGIALGGGGAKGLAHIGVLEGLEEIGIKPKYVAGTSIGAIVGAIYALEGRADNLRASARTMIASPEFKELGLDKFYTESSNIFERFKKSLFEKYYFGRLFFERSHYKDEAIRHLFENLFRQKTFDDLKVPFVCNAFDIKSGRQIVFTKGPLADAVRASCAIPGIFPPYTRNTEMLIDGGVINNIPVGPLRDIGAKIILAVDLGSFPSFENEPNTGYKINLRALSFMKYYFDQHLLSDADRVIRPEVSGYHWADFSVLEDLAEKGSEAISLNMDQIRSVTSFWYRLRKLARHYIER